MTLGRELVTFFKDHSDAQFRCFLSHCPFPAGIGVIVEERKGIADSAGLVR
jgi:hypothetical protein